MTKELAILIFWGTALLLAFTFVGYPVLMSLKRKAPTPSFPPVYPTVDCVIVAHNEASRIAARLENLMASEYPPDRLRFIVVCDGCTDATAQIAREAGRERVQVLELSPQQGKAAGLNAGLAAASGEVVVFADARQQFAPNAITWLVRHLMQPGVGAVSGNYSLLPPADNVGSGVDVYWRWEKFLRQAESRWDSVIGCTGAIYAIRRELFEPLPPDTILDDVVIPMRIVVRGLRVDFAPEALAWETMPVIAEREFQRKRRTLAGNFQMLLRYPQWLLPWHNRLWWALLCHKYLRLLAPPTLLLLFLANLWLARFSPFYAGLLAAQLAFYLLAILGLVFPQWRCRCFTLPAGFVFLNAATVAALGYYLRHGGRGGWQSQPPTQSHVQSAG
jgi:cellulose synthase/poly-beta-1,6-N-acetylglucosamine synthase-like glycosyltransferase